MNGARWKDLKFSKSYVTSTWLTSGSLRRASVGKFFEDVVRAMPSTTKTLFLGCSFGKFGLQIEFSSESPRVASFVAKKMQDIARRCQVQEKLPTSASIVVGRELLFEESSDPQPLEAGNEKLRAYVFLNPTLMKSRQSLMSLYNHVSQNRDLRLYWNSSAFSLMLVVKADCFFDLFSRILAFRSSIEYDTMPTSTFFVLRWDRQGQDFFKDIPKTILGKTMRIPAIVYAKLSNQLSQGKPLTLNVDPSIWSIVFSHKQTEFRRPGWLDECLMIEADSIYDIMKAVCGLIEANPNAISHTSSILLFPAKEVE